MAEHCSINTETTNRGERPIALAPLLYRVWARASKQPLTEWEDARAGHWDTAVRRSSVLRAAVRRALFEENDVSQGRATFSILWHLEEFYDNISVARRLQEAIRLGYPRRPLVVGLCSTWLRESSGVANAPARNFNIAGRTQSNVFAHVILNEILETLHRSCP